MKSVKKTLYYCDYCKRRKFYKPCMVKHERGCTKNPARVCGICPIIAGGEKNLRRPIIADLIAAAKTQDLKTLRAVADNCPACILAGIVQHNAPYVGKFEAPESDPFWSPDEFKFKEELAAVWQQVNEDRSAHASY